MAFELIVSLNTMSEILASGLPMTGTSKRDEELGHGALADIAWALWWSKGSALNQTPGSDGQRPLCSCVSDSWEAKFEWRTKPFLKNGCLG